MIRRNRAGITMPQLNQMIDESIVVLLTTINKRLGWDRTTYRHRDGTVFTVANTSAIYVSFGVGTFRES